MISVFHKDDLTGTPKEAERVRIRTFHRKNKNGCETCKRRKIRCDETRPSCPRCTRSSIDCEGYKHAAPLETASADTHEVHSSGDETRSLTGSDDEVTSSSGETGCGNDSDAITPVQYVDRGLFSWKLNDEQSRGFAFWHLQTLPSLRVLNHSSDVLYSRFVPSLAVSDDLILRMISAVGTLHLERVYMARTPRESRSILKEYGYALKRLSSSNNLDRIGILTACLLFINMEMLFGRFHAAMIHVRRGIDILATTACDGSKYRSTDPNSSIELFHLRVLISQIAELAGILNFVRDGTEESGKVELPDFEKDLEDHREARRGSRKLARYCTNVGFDTEYTQSLWQKWHVKVNALAWKLSLTSKSAVVDELMSL